MSELVAEGVESEVADADERTVGHVAMLDVDADERPPALSSGVSVTLSTANGFHVLDLTPRPWDETVELLDELAADLDADAEYVDEMERRGRATLRTSAELASDGSERSPAPEVVDVRVAPSAERVSGPHARIYARLAEDGSASERVLSDLASGLFAGVETVGDLVVESKYRTRTDEVSV